MFAVPFYAFFIQRSPCNILKTQERPLDDERIYYISGTICFGSVAMKEGILSTA